MKKERVAITGRDPGAIPTMRSPPEGCPCSVSAVSGSISSRSNSSLTIPSRPLPAAHQSGARLYFVSAALGLILSRSNSPLTIPLSPTTAATKVVFDHILLAAVLGLTFCHFNNGFTTPSSLGRTAHQSGPQP